MQFAVLVKIETEESYIISSFCQPHPQRSNKHGLCMYVVFKASLHAILVTCPYILGRPFSSCSVTCIYYLSMYNLNVSYSLILISKLSHWFQKWINNEHINNFHPICERNLTGELVSVILISTYPFSSLKLGLQFLKIWLIIKKMNLSKLGFTYLFWRKKIQKTKVYLIWHCKILYVRIISVKISLELSKKLFFFFIDCSKNATKIDLFPG